MRAGLFSSKSLRACTVLLLALWISCIGCSDRKGEKPGAGKTEKLTILFASDLLGKIRSCGCTESEMGGLGRKATYIERVRNIATNILVVDAGDAFSLDLSFNKAEAELTFDAFELMQLDAFTPGEVEFIFGLPFIRGMAERVTFDILAANIVEAGSGRRVFGPAYKIKELGGGLKVGVTGIIDESIRFPVYIDKSPFKVLPAKETLKKILPEMKREADLLVLLSHMGLEKSRALAREVPDFDVIVVGHGKPVVKTLEKVGETLMLATGGLGQYMGRADLSITEEGYEVNRLKIDPLVEEIAIHQGVKEIFEGYDVPLTDKGKHGKP